MRDAIPQKPGAIFPAGPLPPFCRYPCTCRLALWETVTACARWDAGTSLAELSSSGCSTAVQCRERETAASQSDSMEPPKSPVTNSSAWARNFSFFLCFFFLCFSFQASLVPLFAWEIFTKSWRRSCSGDAQNGQKCCIAAWSIRVCIGSSRNHLLGLQDATAV